MSDESNPHEAREINPGYALLQLAKALTTSVTHADAETRARADEKMAKWVAVFRGILDGSLAVGSRTPLGGVPSWATLEVVTGGFATGRLLASGPLLEHERALVTEFPSLADGESRAMLNAFYLSEQGMSRLGEQLRTGHYEIEVPEEGALLVVAWLLDQGYGEEARELLSVIAPFFSQLRFYPIPADRSLRLGAQVFLQNVGDTIRGLEHLETPLSILAQKEAIEIWAPLYDDVARLLFETVTGDPPSLRLGEDGKPIIGVDGWQLVEGGWPCRKFPEGWTQRSQRVLDEYHRLRLEHTLSYKPEERVGNFSQMRDFLQRCISQPLSISARQVRWLRLVMARYAYKYGLPDSPRHKEFRRKQERQVDIPIYKEIAPVVVARLAAHDKADGIANLDEIIQPVSSQEAAQWQLDAGVQIPAKIEKKLQRSIIDSIEGLVERKLISSGDMVAQVLPQITAEIRAAAIVDPTLRQLYAAIYRAFRRRRSLLLLNYESQVRLEELPWVAAIERYRKEQLSTRELASQTFDEVATLAFTSFPYAILPNKLLQELRALAEGADFNIPFVDEVAADIFMGDFSPKFLYAAKIAADLLQGTLYDRYYGLDDAAVRRLYEAEQHKPKPEEKKSNRLQSQRSDGDSFGALCTRHAGVSKDGWSVARNGMIIEQEQILTTQNLAPIFAARGLATVLHDQLEEMARKCFVWICQRQQMKIDNWHGHLIMIKNTAYAWRQMIFFLSFLSKTELQGFTTWAQGEFSQQGEEFQARFRPAMNGLVLAVDGGSLDTIGMADPHVRRFLGWSEGKHWLLADA